MKSDKLKEIMQKRGYTFEDLAYLSKVPYSTLTKIGTGVTKNPGFVTIEQVAGILQCSLDEFSEKEPIVPYEYEEYIYKFKRLPDNVKEYIKYIIDSEYDLMIHMKTTDKIMLKCLIFSDIVDGAARYDSHISVDIKVSDNDMARQCTFCVYVATTDLMPKFCKYSLLGFRYDDGCIPKNGEIWIIIKNGYMQMMQMRIRDHEIYARSVNRPFEEWGICDCKKNKIIGKFVGILREPGIVFPE